MKKNTLTIGKKSYIQIKNEWERIQTLDIRSKLKAMRAISNAIVSSYEKKEIDIEQLTLYRHIIKQVAKTRSFPERAWLFLSKLTADWLELTGHDKSKIISKIAGKISVDSVSIVISDPSYGKIYDLENDLSLINQGKGYIFSAEGDGVYNVQLRIT